MEKKNTKNVKLTTGEKLTSAEILTTFLTSEGMTANEMAQRIGVDRQTLYDILSGKTKKITLRLSEKITAKFTNVNPRWLRTGEGEMLVNTSPKVVQIAQDSHDFSQNVHNNPHTCDACALLRDAREQINRLLSIIERLQM